MNGYNASECGGIIPYSHGRSDGLLQVDNVLFIVDIATSLSRPFNSHNERRLF